MTQRQQKGPRKKVQTAYLQEGTSSPGLREERIDNPTGPWSLKIIWIIGNHNKVAPEGKERSLKWQKNKSTQCTDQASDVIVLSKEQQSPWPVSK